LCLEGFDGMEIVGARTGTAQLCVVPADINTFAADESTWKRIYSSQRLELPTERIRASVSGEMMLPYFNAGFIAIDAGVDLASAWLRVCRAIDADTSITNKRPWLDQIALPVAARWLGITTRLLDCRFNFPAHLLEIDPARPPRFAHYHTPKT